MNFTTLDQYLQSYISATKLPGLSLAISNREHTLHTFTYTSDRVSSPPITPHTLFEIGSIGKSFTSILFQQLVDAGDYDLHRPVSEYLPWVDIPSEFGPITTRHLLSHTAGIIEGTDFSGDAVAEVHALRKTQAGSPPGTFFHYSNVGYKLLGVILEHVTGRSYPALVRNRILEPLGMDMTHPAITHDLRPQMAVGYIPLYDDRPSPLDYPIAPGVRLETATADGCIVSNPSDLAKYMRLLIQGGQERVLSAAGYERMIQPAIQIDDEMQYGYGLSMSDNPDGQFVGHTGGMAGGYTTRMMWHVETGYGFIVMVNSIGVPGTQEVEAWLQQVLATLVSGKNLPPLEGPADPFVIADAGRYVGTYSDGNRTLTILAHGDRLFLDRDGTEQPLARRASDRFTCDHPDFDRFEFAFQRDDDDAVKSVTHGERLYMAAGVDRPEVDYPAEWEAYRGHYRSHNPWLPSIRVLLRAGTLFLQSGNDESRLVPFDDGAFRVGEDEHLPERLRFDLLIEGRAIRALLNSAPFYRTFTA